MKITPGDNLRQFPRVLSFSPEVKDLYLEINNVIALLNLLFQCNILKFSSDESSNEQSYQKIIDICEEEALNGNDLLHFNRLLASASVGMNAGKTVLISGKVFNVNENPALALNIFKALDEKNINFSILFTKEAKEICDYFLHESGKQETLPLLTPVTKKYDNAYNLDWISEEEHKAYEECFIENFALLGCEIDRTLDPEAFVLYTHKKIDAEIVPAFVEFFKDAASYLNKENLISSDAKSMLQRQLVDVDDSLENLRLTVLSINKIYQWFLKYNLDLHLNQLITDRERKLAVIKNVNQMLLTLPGAKEQSCSHGDCQLKRYKQKQSCVDPLSLLQKLHAKPTKFFLELDGILATIDSAMELADPQSAAIYLAIKAAILSLHPFYFLTIGRIFTKEQVREVFEEKKQQKLNHNVFLGDEDFNQYYERLVAELLRRLEPGENRLFGLFNDDAINACYKSIAALIQQSKALPAADKLASLYSELLIQKENLNDQSWFCGKQKAALRFACINIEKPPYNGNEAMHQQVITQVQFQFSVANSSKLFSKLKLIN